MSRDQQVLPLAWSLGEVYRREGDALLRVAAEVAARAGKQGANLAADLEVDPAQFSRALHGKRTEGARTHFSLAWLPALLHADSERLMVRHLAALVGCNVVPRRELTDKEKLDRLLHELRQAGAAGEAIQRRALGDEF